MALWAPTMVTLAPSTPKNVQVAPPWELMVSMARLLSAPHGWAQVRSQGRRKEGGGIKEKPSLYGSWFFYN